jgi:NAD dependent epimerase/dehydratase
VTARPGRANEGIGMPTQTRMRTSLTGKRVLVTGAGGFIGSHLVEALAAEGAQVRALVHYNSRNDWGQLERLDPRLLEPIDVRMGNIRDPFFMERVTEGCAVVFHLAALIPIPYSYVAPSEFVETNVRGTLNVLEAARACGVERLVHTSTSETYGTARYTPIDEEHPLQGLSPYSASKIGADKMAESYWRSFRTPVVTLRPFNTYGPRQSARAFLPTVITQVLTSDVVKVGSLDPVRDMNYVDDTVRGFLLAAAAPGIEGMTLNVGSGRGVSMRELTEIVFRVAGKSPRLESDPERVRPDASEVHELVCGAELARERMGWTSQVDLEDGVRRTLAWISEHLGDYKPQLYTI